METLFFLIQIGGMVAIVLWAHLNDGCGTTGAQRGLLAMAAPKAPKTGKTEVRPRFTKRTDPPAKRTDVAAKRADTAPEARPAPPRRRFLEP